MAVHGEPSTGQAGQADRKLGDEWEDWDGQVGSGDSSAPAWFFVVLSGGVILLVWLAGLALTWLVFPRLADLGVPLIAYAMAGLWTVFLGVWYGSLLAALITRSMFFQRIVRRLGGIAWMASPAAWLGRRIGISRDRVSHAFMLVHNRLEILPPVVGEPEKLLILVPRCLSRDVFQALAQMKTRYGFTQMTVTGGTEARRAIGKLKPQGILAVACERDLLSGVKDVRGRVPVLAIANQRPEGPCQNTWVDLNRIEDGIKSFLGQFKAKEEKVP